MAIDPRAIGSGFPSLGGSAFVSQADRIAILRIEGPLSRRSSWYGDGYDDIAEAFADALEDPSVGAVVLRIDSPGGACNGNIETARAMRALADTAGKPVIAYVDEVACSAAYALACIADEIWLPPSAMVGSVGTVITLDEYTKQNERVGIRVEVVASGAEKTDGHPDVPLTDEAIARFRSMVETLAGQFAELVGARRHMTAEAVLAMEAGTFLGSAAVDAGLADHVGNFTQALAATTARIGTTTTARLARAEGNTMKTLFAKLGLAESATEAEAIAAVSPFLSVQHELAALTAKGSTAEQLAVVQAWKAGNEQLAIEKAKTAKAEADLKAVEVAAEKARQASELAVAIEAGRKAGKLTKAQAEGWALTQTAEGLAAFLEHAPVVLAREPVVSAGDSAGANDAAASKDAPLSTEERQVMKQLGLTEKQMLAGRKAPKETK